METTSPLVTVLVALACLGVGLLVGWLWRAARAAEGRRDADVEIERLRSEVQGARREAEQQVRIAREEQELAARRFRALAGEALAANTQQFLALAEQRLATSSAQGDAALAEREQAVRALVDPLTRAVDRVRAEVAEAERARREGHGALAQQVRSMAEASADLRGETGRLVTALRSSQVRGAWGEMQLRRVVEAAGMLAHVDFTEQEHVTTDDGALRPDMVVHLAGGKKVVVDSKVAFLGYLEAQEAADERVRAERLAAHARHVRKHVDDLASKRYWDQFSPAPEFVVMFVPAEAFLSAAVEQDPGLLEYAVARDVVVATPMTLVALLRTVAYAWRQDALAENAQRVLTVGKELHGRLATLGTHLDKLGRQIGGTARAYNQVVGSLESRVLVSARRFAELGVVDAPVEAPASIDPAVTLLRAPELVASADELVVALEDVASPDRTAGDPGDPDGLGDGLGGGLGDARDDDRDAGQGRHAG